MTFNFGKVGDRKIGVLWGVAVIAGVVATLSLAVLIAVVVALRVRDVMRVVAVKVGDLMRVVAVRVRDLLCVTVRVRDLMRDVAFVTT